MLKKREPLVFVHGWGANSRVWEAQEEFFRSDYDVYAVDMPGHGNKPPLSENATLAGYGRELAQFLLREKITGAHLVGWSLASQVIFHSAAEAGDAVKSLTFVDGTPCFVAPDGCEWGINPTKAAWFRRSMRSDFRKGLEIFVTSFVRYEKEDAPDLAEKLLKIVLSHPPDEKSALELLDDFHNSDLRPVLGSVRLPTFAIHGGRDRIVPPGAVEMWKAAPQFRRSCVMPELGHAPFMTAPEKFNAELKSFLSAL